MTFGKTSSGHDVHHIDHDVYRQTEKPPKYNIHVSPLHDKEAGGKMLRKRLPHYSKQDHLDAAQAHRAEAKHHSESWARTREEAHQATFGKKPEFHDYKVSGIGREEYSEPHKSQLRRHAHSQTQHNAAADAHEAAAKGYRASSQHSEEDAPDYNPHFVYGGGVVAPPVPMSRETTTQHSEQPSPPQVSSFGAGVRY